MRISLFIPCFVDLLRPEVGVATARILSELGHDVSYPDRQTCCGQPALNAGLFGDALRVARRQLDVLAEGDPDAVVAPSGSCVAALRVAAREQLGIEHPLQARLFELSELLTDVLGVTDLGASFPARVTWHDGCHALRELGVRDGPRALLGAVRGLELVEMPSAAECCGFGGTFAVKHAPASVGMGARKVAAIEASGADVVASTEPSCLLQIDGLLRARESRVRALHLAEILGGAA